MIINFKIHSYVYLSAIISWFPSSYLSYVAHNEEFT